MADATSETSLQRGRWAVRHVAPPPRSIVDLLRSGTLDADLAATTWLLLEHRVALLVAADGHGTGKSTLLEALLAFVPTDIRRVDLQGDEETFDWLPQASELGWDRTPGRRRADERAAAPVRPDTTVLVAAELSDHLPSYTWGSAARIAVRAASIGYGLAATIHADALEAVFATLAGPPVELSDDELSRLGVVLIVRRLRDDRRRVIAAHYVRPTARDEHGHVQRLGPAVLATWDETADRFEHFGWAIAPELASRIGWRPGDLELEIDRRRAYLDHLADAGIVAVDDVRAAIAAYRPLVPTPST
jgi:flagellar protein FlaI